MAHRGAPDRALENSLAGIALAAADGADMIEFDVRLTADGEPVVLHDARTGRTAKENLPVASTPSARIRKVLLKNGEPVPLLADVLEHVRGRIPVNIHVKTSGGTAAVCRVLTGMGYEGEVVLSSGLREECLAARTLRPDLPCGLVTRRPSASDIAFCVRNALPSIHPDHRRLSLLRMRKVKSAGLVLIPYTVDDPEEFFRLVDAGADGVFSNRAEALRAAWRERSR
ncbi:MAG TPA: glycerophosphodiester phosphodiesterase [Candidatus Limnocylindrales bacterium]|nr:glycerophosphodiester phosphodiesterase [Candidatus Limnocylindrales bacterium]